MVDVVGAFWWLFMSLDAWKTWIIVLFLAGGLLTVLGISAVMFEVNKRHKEFLKFKAGQQALQAAESAMYANIMAAVRSIPVAAGPGPFAEANRDAPRQVLNYFNQGKTVPLVSSILHSALQDEHTEVTAPTGKLRDHWGSAALVLGVVLQTVASIMSLF
jgi:hypothetical protein